MVNEYGPQISISDLERQLRAASNYFILFWPESDFVKEKMCKQRILFVMLLLVIFTPIAEGYYFFHHYYDSSSTESYGMFLQFFEIVLESQAIWSERKQRFE